MKTLLLRIDVPRQTLTLVEDGHAVARHPVSTSCFGIGTEPGSHRTPPGRFTICAKFGRGAPAGMIFRGRRPTGQLAALSGGDDLVLTRILWLDGRDPENANTRDRFIYLHGTNQEHLIGRPASHGCVRLRNADIIDLFERVPVGTPVTINA